MEAKPQRFVKLFQPQFAPLVEQGIKCQTIRPVPKRMPKPGDFVSLRAWTGKPYRSPQRILREAVITEAVKIRIEPGRIWMAGGGIITRHPHRHSGDQTLDSFAMADGFESWQRMHACFEQQHGLPFNGLLISWQPTANSEPTTVN